MRFVLTITVDRADDKRIAGEMGEHIRQQIQDFADNMSIDDFELANGDRVEFTVAADVEQK